MSASLPGSSGFRSRAQAFARARGAQLQEQAARWQLNGRRYLRNYPGLAKAMVRIEVDPKLSDRVVKWIENVAPAVARVYEDRLSTLARSAFDAWPVDSGFSKSALGVEYQLRSPVVFVGRIFDRAPYAAFINKGETVKELIFKPGLVTADKMVDDLVGERLIQ